MKRTLIALIACVGIISLVGCNTFRGAGQDVENTGKNMKDVVNHND